MWYRLDGRGRQGRGEGTTCIWHEPYSHGMHSKRLTFRFFNPRRSMPAEEAVMVAVVMVHLLNGGDTAGGWDTEPVVE